MKTKYILLLAFIVGNATILSAQTNTFPSTGAAGIGTNSPNASSLLEIKSTTKGILIPRMTLVQRNAIATPAAGLLIYQTNSTPGFYYYNGTSWIAIAPKSAVWNLTGNAGTDSSINFVGTTDAHPLVFKVNKIKSGYIDNVNRNTAFGYQSLFSNAAGGSNTAIGFSALFNNGIGANVSLDQGTRNTAIGSFSMYSNTIGLYNTAIGVYSLSANVDGSFNTAMGVNALTNNTDGHDNTAIGLAALEANLHGNLNVATGSRALQANTTGSSNTANGSSSLFSNTTGSANTAFGFEALYQNITGGNNTAIGFQSLHSSNSGFNNIAFGYQSQFNSTNTSSNVAVGTQTLYNNVNGIQNTALGDFALYSNAVDSNTAIGYAASYSNTNGRNNTTVGYAAAYSNTSGNLNTAVGHEALWANAKGSYNTAIGNNAGSSLTTGSNNIFIGYKADGAASINNSVCIGNNVFTNQSNVLILGNNQNVGIGISTPVYKLDVCGIMRAKEVLVQTGWCDYVFDKDYKLRSLSEVDNYIQQNKHLPDVPSATDVEANGIKVAQMDSVLIKKMEELTLYVIYQNKQIEQLQQKVLQLEKGDIRKKDK
jgi:hypothetical protein